MSSRVAEILLPIPFDHGFDYALPEDHKLQEGSFVRVPFRSGVMDGIVWNLTPPKSGYQGKLKSIISAPLFDPLSPELVKFIKWVAFYTLAPVGLVYKMVITHKEMLDFGKEVKYFALSPSASTLEKTLSMTRPRLRVKDCLLENGALPLSDLTYLAEISGSVVKRLEELGFLETHFVEETLPCEFPKILPDRPPLEPDQQAAAEQLVRALDHKEFKPFLLDGVTGSGKTEVYFEAIARAISQEKQSLVMLPEIALSSQWSTRFEERFGFAPLQWHSGLTQPQRKKNWHKIHQGLAPVVIGARSSLFLPYKNLGVIIVDEEHDASYKQEEVVLYNARDMAVVRAHLEKIPVVLASATPSVETVTNADERKYTHLLLPTRFGAATLPPIHLIDMRDQEKVSQEWISGDLKTQMEIALESNQQIMLFLNRRGYAPLTLCRSCGYREMCEHCAAWLVEHRHGKQLHCHHCGYNKPMPKVCGECDAEESYVSCGPGVERIAEEAAAKFPNAKVEVVASDTYAGPDEMATLVDKVNKGQVDILIGTQMMAKGYHFPNLTLVGVIDADLGLSGGDLRAGERTYQLLHQVAGRAGRADKKGQVLLQTYMPEHPIMQALSHGGREEFLNQEINEREMATMPPFGKLVGVIISGSHLHIVEDSARRLARSFPVSAEASVLGPTPAPLAMLRGQHRWRLLVKCPRETKAQSLVRHWVDQTPLSPKVRVQIDVDPYSFY